ncbi:OmpW/AlkL family protein [Castellaniella sp.]|uniref:OmpW/AlkL family protein n=1 Tax=Castellaniella sp. TaxID=1955812 RepID=UPI002AFDFEEE|nr:OmpW family outer membrane protein [Castellaniella sp.]
MASYLRQTTLACALVACSVAASPVLAHEAGDILVKVGVTHVEPKSNNGTVANGAVKLDIDGSTRPSLSVTYMATQNIGIELLAAVPFKHTINAKGIGEIGSTKQLPPTLSVQWHFLPESTFQPYVGIGLNYTTFFSTKSSLGDLSLGDSWGVAAQAGVDIKLNERWFLNADLRYIDISSTVRLNGANIGKARVDPWVATVGVGYRF